MKRVKNRPTSDYFLTDQLYSFMQSVPFLWSYETLAEILKSGRTHTEYRGPEDNLLEFDMQVLECETKHEEEYLHVLVGVSDTNREVKQKGSSYAPLSTTFLWFRSNEIDMPTAAEIYEELK